jgi:hypothetical protein
MRPGANASGGVPTESAKTLDSNNSGHGAKSAFAHPALLNQRFSRLIPMH